MLPRQNFESRWTENFDKLSWSAPAKFQMNRHLDMDDRVRAKRAELAGNPEISPVGRQNAIRKFIADEIAPDVRRGRKAVEAMSAKIAARRARIQPPPPDKNDAAGAILRSEYRQMLRQMSNGERVAFLMQNDDPVMAAAALEVPPRVLNLPNEVRQHLINTEIERSHPGALAALDDAEEMATLVKSTFDYAVNTTRNAVDMPEHAFTNFIDGSTGNKAAAIDQNVTSVFSSFADAA